jgi:hypothetical protein
MGWAVRVSILVTERNFSRLQNVQIVRGTHINPPVPYVPGKVAGP